MALARRGLHVELLNGRWAPLTDYDRMIQRPELKYMHPLMLDAFWHKPNNPYLKQAADPKFFRGLYADENGRVLRDT